jgi:hypothetical protein
MANREWQAGDRAIAIPVDGGWVYMDQKAIDYFGEEVLKQTDGAIDAVVIAG